MQRKILIATFMMAFAIPSAMAADGPTSIKLSAAEIVNKNVAARGGLQAWRAVHSLTQTGKLGAGGDRRETLPMPLPSGKPNGKQDRLPSPQRLAQEAQLPFVMEMERPRKVRLELQFKGKTALQVYDGTNGWKLRPYLDRLDVENYTEDELAKASMQSELDGPLVDYATKGTRVELVGTEKVEDRDTYKLKLTMKNGHETHVWIDTQTFLEAKIEGQPRRLDGKQHAVEIYYRDYRLIDGLQIPFVLETKVLPLSVAGERVKDRPIPTEKITIETVVVNPKLDASLFTKPQIQTASVQH